MLFEKEIGKVGYLSRSVPEGIDLAKEILRLKKDGVEVIGARLL